ncbi:MAG: NAD-dependent epimerase/dehydratase family protein [Planctomycetes bacterium]|nr:NAD-dependent epimerase/dehydratase family protein [Planctomycetota bacterium]
MKKAFVTGASGFIGAAVARQLVADGVHVRVLMRAEADHANIKGLPVEVVTGDLLDASALARGLVGCDACFHVAGMNALSPRGRQVQAMYDANARGAEMVLKTAAVAGCASIVHTSTIACIGKPPVNEHRPPDERDLADPDEFSVHYQRSKALGEKHALRLAAEGAPVVVVNPSAPMGPFDVKPTPTGRVVLDFLLRRIPGYMETGLNIIDVDDCARGHILAAQKGKRGERYILAHENVGLRDIFGALAEVSGHAAPTMKVPAWLALTGAFFSELKGKLLGRPPAVPLAGVRMALKPMYVSNKKAVEQLGLPTRPVPETLRRAAAWFVHHNYAPKPPKELGAW